MNDKRLEQLIYLCQEFVRIPSLSGREENMARSVAATGRALGYDRVETDHYGNILMRVRFSEDGPRLLLHAQMDHVDPGDSADWAFYPYSAEINRKRIYGSGSMDQKGSLAAMILAGAFLKEDMRNNGLRGELIVAAAVQQECFDALAARAIASAVKPDVVIVGDASELEIVRGQPGRAKIALRTEGHMAHVLSPAYGVNAAEEMLAVLDAIKKKYVVPADPFLGEGTLVLTGLSTWPDALEKVIPGRCIATFVKRTLPGETRSDCIEQIERLVAPLRKKDRNLELKISIATTEGRCYTGATLATEQFVPAWFWPPDHPFLCNAQRWLRQAGLKGEISRSPGFGTSAALYAGEQAIPTLIYGPSRPEQAHRVDEYVEIDQLRLACEGYMAMASGFLGMTNSD